MNRPAVLVPLLAVLAAAAFAQDTDAILKLDRDNAVATWTGDARWFEENLADDFAQITVHGKVRTKRDVVQEMAGPGFAMEPYEPTEVQVRMYGETAVVTGRVVQRFARGGMRYEVDARYTDVYVRRRGRWLLVSAHASPVARSRVK